MKQGREWDTRAKGFKHFSSYLVGTMKSAGPSKISCKAKEMEESTLTRSFPTGIIGFSFILVEPRWL